MPYETLIGWRYLFHRPKKGQRRLLAGLLMFFGGALALSAVLWMLSSRPTPVIVFGFFTANLGVIVFALLNIFSVFISVSVFGVVLGVTALVLVLSVTSGFQQQFRDKVLGV